MENVLLSPPVAFLIVFAFIGLFSAALSKLAFRPKTRAPDAGKSYACGEDAPTNLVQPDYTQFFPFAFFFTIAHVATLMLATVPEMSLRVFVTAVVYIVAVFIGLFILLWG